MDHTMQFWLVVIAQDQGWPKTEQYPDGGKFTPRVCVLWLDLESLVELFFKQA